MYPNELRCDEREEMICKELSVLKAQRHQLADELEMVRDEENILLREKQILEQLRLLRQEVNR